MFRQFHFTILTLFPQFIYFGAVALVAMGLAATANNYTSVAIGDEANASGWGAVALGKSTTASGTYATALGKSTTASGSQSTAMGQTTTASASGATAMGVSTTASGTNSTAMGQSSTASGAVSTAMGVNTIANADASTAMGQTTTASGINATAMGAITIASGNNATAMGNGTIAAALGETAIGAYNTNATSPNATDWIATDRLFTIGNGVDANNKSNALVMLKNGNTTFTATVTAPAFVTSSDRRFKTNIVALNNVSGSALANLSNIGAYYYDYKVAEFPERQFSTEKQIGFIAQELEAIYPELVKTDEKGYKSVDYAKVTPILVEAIKELKAENEALKAESNVSKQDLNLLKAQVEKLNDATFGNAQK